MRWWPGRRKNPQKPQRFAAVPQGVRIRHPGGQVTECTVARQDDSDYGYARWVVVPPKGTTFNVIAGDQLEVDWQPHRTELLFWAETHPPVPPGPYWFAPGGN